MARDRCLDPDRGVGPQGQPGRVEKQAFEAVFLGQALVEGKVAVPVDVPARSAAPAGVSIVPLWLEVKVASSLVPATPSIVSGPPIV